MSNSFDALKKSAKTSAAAITEAAAKLNQKGPATDDRYWSPTLDKAGNGYAVIRFLPAPINEDVPFVRMFSHAFKGPTGLWYIENSRTTLNNDADPVGEYNQTLWATGSDENKAAVRRQKRNLKYISNIYVEKDSAHPENEGKVFLYKYGKKIFDRLNEAMNPQFEGEVAINPFDFWNGASFKLKIRKVDGFPNYDKSEFAEVTALSTDEKELKRIWESEHSLVAEIAPSKFKSYADLKAQMIRVLCLNTPTDDIPFEAPAKSTKTAAAPKMSQTPANNDFNHDEEDSEDLAFFRNLAESDD